MKNVRRLLIIGANGRLGAALARDYQRVFSVKAFARSQLDLGKLDQIRSVLSGTEFDLLINCAALTNVDYCESHQDEALLSQCASAAVTGGDLLLRNRRSWFTSALTTFSTASKTLLI